MFASTRGMASASSHERHDPCSHVIDRLQRSGKPMTKQQTSGAGNVNRNIRIDRWGTYD